MKEVQEYKKLLKEEEGKKAANIEICDEEILT